MMHTLSAVYRVLKDCVFQAWKAWRSWPKKAVAFAAECWQWVLHFRSLEKYTPTRSLLLVICLRVSLESESADLMVNLVWGQKLLVLFLKTIYLHFWPLKLICQLHAQIVRRSMSACSWAASFPFLIVVMIFVSSVKSLQWWLRLVDMSLIVDS